MPATKVFEIIEMEAAQNIGMVWGRAYEDVRVGDTVFVEGNDARPDEYKIISIVTYWHEMSFLGGGTTGQLTLEGANPQALRNVRHLLKRG